MPTPAEKILEFLVKLDVKLDAIIKAQGEQAAALEVIKDALATEPEDL